MKDRCAPVRVKLYIVFASHLGKTAIKEPVTDVTQVLRVNIYKSSWATVWKTAKNTNASYITADVIAIIDLYLF
ncbi:hypothetical protein chiPu_0005247 [Chiloscyllium punctatum]|uniref:Uncharacterized protein n=1 Tax=Chiloscyllium punctatum TaxID=137246 RepID=A0A401S8V0_CHIPU|nr:hypothetical protein [Chiloscyllium punctatum]